MSSPAPHSTAGGWLLERLVVAEGVGLRQVPFTVVYSFLWALVLLPAARPALGSPTSWFEMWLGLAVVLAVQVAGVLFPWDRFGAGWQSVLPLSQLGALVALQVGSGTVLSSLGALVLLPVVSLGLQATWSGVVLATVGTVVVVVVPGGDVVSAVVVSSVAFLVALGTAGAARRLRAARRPGRRVVGPASAGRYELPDDLTAGLPQGELIGLVGHELRSPMTSVLGYVQLLGADSLTAEQHRYVDVIERNGRRLLRSIDELLAGAQLSTQGHSLTWRDVDLAEVSRTCGGELGSAAQAAAVALVVRTPGPVPVRGDPQFLAQMVTSLLDGAIRRTPRGGAVTIGARVAVAGQAGAGGGAVQEAVVEVADTGVRIGGDDLSEQGHGSRLGLLVVQAIVDAHDGVVTVDSLPGQGSSVTVTLPTGWSGEARSTPH